jgi:hypothetical protein
VRYSPDLNSFARNFLERMDYLFKKYNLCKNYDDADQFLARLLYKES